MFLLMPKDSILSPFGKEIRGLIINCINSTLTDLSFRI